MTVPPHALDTITDTRSLTPSKDDKRFLVARWMIAALAAANAILLLTDHQPVDALGLSAASATVWICAIPLWRFVTARRRTIPFMVFCGVLYASYYALPIFSSKPLFRQSPRVPPWDSVETALELSLLGAVALMAGTYGVRSLVHKIPQVRRDIDFKRAVPILIFVAALAPGLRLISGGDTSSRFAQPLLAVEGCGEIALAGLLVAWLRGYLRWWQKIYFIALIAIIIALGLVTGMLANIAFPIAGLVFVYCWERRRIPWGALVAGIILLAPFQATKYKYRKIYWTESTQGLSTTTAGLLVGFLSMTVNSIARGELSSDEIADLNEARTNSLATFAIVVNDTPRIVPYWNGYTYAELPWKFVPRFVVPNKPAPKIGVEFPFRYQIISYESSTTSYNLTQLIELYINFGPAAVGIGMLFIGLIYAMLDHAFSASSGGALMGCVTFSGLMNIESNFSGVFGGLPFLLLVYYVFIRILPETEPPPVAAAA